MIIGFGKRDRSGTFFVSFVSKKMAVFIPNSKTKKGVK